MMNRPLSKATECFNVTEMIILMRPLFAILLITSLLPSPASASDLGRDLEKSYNTWRSAMVSKQASTWQKATAPHRVMSAHNLIVSQRLKWPNALFEVPVNPPEISQLKRVGAGVVGATAHAAFFGKVDFGIKAGDIPDNILIIHYTRNGSSWLYDRSQFVNLAAHPDIGALVAASDYRWLGSKSYAPSGIVPPTPKRCPKPDYIGHIRIASHGYKTTLKFRSGHHISIADDAITTDLIIGGLATGENRFTVTAKPLPKAKGAKDTKPTTDETIPWSITVFATSDMQKRAAAKVFHYAPDTPPADEMSSAVWVTAATLQRR